MRSISCGRYPGARRGLCDRQGVRPPGGQGALLKQLRGMADVLFGDRGRLDLFRLSLTS